MKRLTLILLAVLLTGTVVFAADTPAPAVPNATPGVTDGYGMRGPGSGMGMGRGGMMRGSGPLLQNQDLLKNPINVSGTVSFDQNYVVLKAQDKSYVLIFPAFFGLDTTVLKDGVQVKVDGYTYKPASIEYKADLDRIVVKAITVGDKTYDASTAKTGPRGSFGMPNMGGLRDGGRSGGARGERW
jgi:hypothetical protein